MEQKWFINLSAENDLGTEDLGDFIYHGLAGVAIRLGRGEQLDPSAEEHVSTAKILNLPFMLYLNLDAEVSPGDQLKVLRNAIEEYSPNSVAVVMDQWWMNWKEYEQNQIDKSSFVRSFTSERLINIYRPLLIALKDLGVPAGIASTPEFISNHCRRLAVEANEGQFYWNIGMLTLPNFKLPYLTWKDLEHLLNSEFNPRKLPHGIRKADAWEFTHSPLETYGAFKISMITKEGLEVMFGEVAEEKKPKRKTAKKAKKVKLEIPEETFAGEPEEVKGEEEPFWKHEDLFNELSNRPDEEEENGGNRHETI